MTTWTTLHIAPFTQPDGTTRALSRIDFKSTVPEAQAVDRAKHIIRTDRSLDRGYLLNCLDIGNYVYGDLTDTPRTPRATTQTTATDTPAAPIQHIPSRNAADTPDGAVTAALKPNPQYTGTAIIGIATMHKSNLVPIFNAEAAVDAATMRRG